MFFNKKVEVNTHIQKPGSEIYKSLTEAKNAIYAYKKQLEAAFHKHNDIDAGEELLEILKNGYPCMYLSPASYYAKHLITGENKLEAGIIESHLEIKKAAMDQNSCN